jgi:putative NIF3 family GTP cyclohydrolase 1 type 2
LLNALSQGKAVILGEHSNTERGYLSKMQSLLQAEMDRVTQNEKEERDAQYAVHISKVDADPVVII